MKNNARRIQNKLEKALTFLIRFNIFAIPLYAIMVTGFSIKAWQDFTAALVSYILSSIGIHNSMTGLLISVTAPGGSFAGMIDWDCTGWKSMLAFLALVFATDASFRKKMVAFALLPVLYIANVLRIVILFWIASRIGTENFQFIHMLLFGFAMICIVLIMWVLWYKLVQNNKKIREIRLAKK